MSIEIHNISKNFGNIKILNKISLKISSGKMLTLVGASGSGKTTLLRILAGLDYQDNGNIYFYGKDVSYLHARHRKVGFVFQNYSLFQNMKIFDNIAFGLKILPKNKRPSTNRIKNYVNNLMEMIQITNLANCYPFQISAGQKQRVALARALAIEPKILLLDEPFSALDFKVRKELFNWLKKLHDNLKFTSIFVTHDQNEAMEISDFMIIINKGNIEQIGKPNDILYQPATRFVLEFFSLTNCFYGEVYGSQFHIGKYFWPLGYESNYQGHVEILSRAWEIEISRQISLNINLPVYVVEMFYKGHFWQLVVKPYKWHDTNIVVIFKDIKQPPFIGEFLFIGFNKVHLYIGSYKIN